MEKKTLDWQREHKPMIEDLMPDHLSGNDLKIAQDFAAYLRENKMKSSWTLNYAWKAISKGKPLYYIRLGWHWKGNGENAKWVVTVYLNHMDTYKDEIFNAGLQDVIWADFNECTSCRDRCSSGTNKTILGKELIGICRSTLGLGRLPVNFVNPDEIAIEQIKQLLALEKQAR